MNGNKDLILNETFALAFLNHEKNNFLIAKNLYNKVLKIDPNHIGALSNLGIVFNLLKEYQNAVNCHEKVIEINPHHADAYINLGIVFSNIEDYQKGISCYEKAIEINPNFTDAHFNLGNIYKKIKKNKKYKTIHTRRRI